MYGCVCKWGPGPPFQVIRQGADCHSNFSASRRKRSSALVSTVSLARDTFAMAFMANCQNTGGYSIAI